MPKKPLSEILKNHYFYQNLHKNCCYGMSVITMCDILSSPQEENAGEGSNLLRILDHNTTPASILHTQVIVWHLIILTSVLSEHSKDKIARSITVDVTIDVPFSASD